MSTSENTLEYDLYVIHTKLDRSFAESVKEKVNATYYGDRRLKTFLFEWDITAGHNIVLEMEKGLQTSRYYGVVLSPSMLQSPWGTREWTIAVTQDPTGKYGRVIPLLYQSCEIPLMLRILRWIDFRDSKNLDEAFGELTSILKRAPLSVESPSLSNLHTLPPQMSSGNNIYSSDPDQITETLASNLFPVVSLPENMFSAETVAQTHTEVYDKVGWDLPIGIVLRESRIYTFDDISQSPVKSVTDSSSIGLTSVTQQLNNPEEEGLLIQLLNSYLRAHCRSLGLRYSKPAKRHFFPSRKDESVAKRSWRIGGRWRSRTVAELDPVTHRWSHFAASLQFMRLGNQFYLEIEPDWLFTEDGIVPISGREVTSLASRKMSREYNAQFRKHIEFWVTTLSQFHHEIIMGKGAGSIIVSKSPLSADINVGIRWD